MLYLEAHLGDRIIRCSVTGRELIVGRADECDFVVRHESISRRHLLVKVDGGRVEITDLSSTNGLYVDGKRVPSAIVGADDVFTIGSVPMCLREGLTLGADGGHEWPGRPRTGSSSHEPFSTGGGLDAAGDPVCDLADRLSECPSADVAASRVLLCAMELVHARGAILLTGWRAKRAIVAAAGDIAGWDACAEGDDADGSVNIDGGDEERLVLREARDWRARRTTLRSLARLAHWFASIESQASSLASPAQDALGPPRFPPPPFVTISQRCMRILAEAERLARSTLSVLLTGESGTGKDLLARRIHAHSQRASGPFVAINCAAVPGELLEAELFGIERGVATGVDARMGRFLQADGGTLFLDEIADLPRGLQPKLLRALENREIVPLGAPQPIRVDIRIVAATHRPYRDLASDGGFRTDLLYRLAGAVVDVPPLRERPEDILPLARSFAREAAARLGRGFAGLDVDAARALHAYAWPGNVRELQHVIHRAVALAEDEILDASLLPAHLRESSETSHLGEIVMALRADWKGAREHFDRLYFASLVDRAAGNLSEAARLAGISRSNLYRKLDELGLRERLDGKDAADDKDETGGC